MSIDLMSMQEKYFRDKPHPIVIEGFIIPVSFYSSNWLRINVENYQIRAIGNKTSDEEFCKISSSLSFLEKDLDKVLLLYTRDWKKLSAVMIQDIMDSGELEQTYGEVMTLHFSSLQYGRVRYDVKSTEFIEMKREEDVVYIPFLLNGILFNYPYSLRESNVNVHRKSLLKRSNFQDLFSPTFEISDLTTKNVKGY